MMLNNFQKSILKTCFLKCETRFASGQKANNKLDLERIATDPHLRKKVVEEIASITKVYNPDFVVGVPQGANWLAADVAFRLDIQKVVLSKNPSTNTMSFATNEDKLKCQKLSHGIIIEDVFSRYTNTRRVLKIPQVANRIVAAISIWDRGLDNGREPLSIKAESLIKLNIPSWLSADSELWRYATKV